MRPCRCGKPVRLGAVRITTNRKRGVVHYIAHADGSLLSGCDWSCSMFKPYPTADADKPWVQMLRRWESADLREALPG